jgi:hypothetical protein
VAQWQFGAIVTKTTCFDVFEQCVNAIQAGELIELESEKDKEFHFQNWFSSRLERLGLNFDSPSRNSYPDFRLVKPAEGYLVICHGDFLNADHSYVHKNKNVKGFGAYGDILIRDRKMYVAPTPFAITDGTTGLKTLIVPENIEPDSRVQEVGRFTRIESDTLLIGYTFDLRRNELQAERISNPNAGAEHRFVAYRLASDAPKPVSMLGKVIIINEKDEADEE